MNSNKFSPAQLLAVAQRLAKLPAEKKQLFRETLEKEGIDPWQLPIVPSTSEQIAADETLPLSFIQQRLWLVEQMQPGNPIYNVFFALKFEGELNVAALTFALNSILKRHQILRTNYVNENGQGRQKVRQFTPLSLPVSDLSNESDPKASLDALMQEEATQPFDLVNDVRMLRVKLVKTSAAETLVLFTIHHIAFDALSTVSFMQALNTGYSAFCADNDFHVEEGELSVEDGAPSEKESVLPVKEEQLQYADFALWQREWAESNKFKQQIQYWQQQLHDAPAKLSLATQYRRPNHISHAGDSAVITLTDKLSKNLQTLADKNSATLYMVMLAAFNVLLSIYSRQEDICIGTSIANRPNVELQELLGCFINTLVMRNKLNPKQRFTELLGQVKCTASDAFSHQDLPFDHLLEVLDVPREDNINPLFQVMFVLNNALDGLSLTLGDTRVSVYPTPLYYSRFDLTLRITEGSAQNKGVQGNTGLHCDMEFNTTLFSKTMIAKMLADYQSLLEQIVARPDAAISELDVNQKNVQEQPNTETPISGYQHLPVEQGSVIAQFEHWATHSPEHAALVFEQQRLTYGQLNQLASSMSQQLIAKGVKPGDKVGIYQDRTAGFIASILAILKAGAAYVPMDSQWPAQRIAKIVADSQIKVLVSEQKFKVNLPLFSGEWLLVQQADTENSQQGIDSSKANSDITIYPESPAYLIYTSGSTGEPKGVRVSHGNLLHYTDSVESRLKLSGKSYALISTVAADLGNTAIFGALCFGGCLHVISEECATDAGKFKDYFAANDIAALKIVPGHLQGLLSANATDDDTDDATNKVASLSNCLPTECLILGGEACSQKLVNHIRNIKPDCRIINHYGPTETTVGALTYELPLSQSLPDSLLTTNLPIGNALPGNIAYVVDQYGHQCPDFVAGELWIAGRGVTQGYQNQPEQTQSRFVANPFVGDLRANSQSVEICYRTGDKVRRLASGEIEFLGRLDEQVKIRGYRVELGEIDVALKQAPGVEQAVVVVHKTETQQAQLVAYVVLNLRERGLQEKASKEDYLNGNVSEDRLQHIQQHLINVLPEYMQPQHIVAIDALPRTSNGKLDRKALPAPQSQTKNAAEDSAPRDEKEQVLADIWCQVLRLEQVGIHDNFFELGGDSILSLQIIARAKKAGFKFTPKQLFDNKTIAALAPLMKDIKAAKPKSAASGAVAQQTDFPLTPIQCWFFEAFSGSREAFSGSTEAASLSNENTVGANQNVANIHHWNQSAIFKINGALDFTALQTAVNAIVQKHPALRLQFNNTDKGWRQSVSKENRSDICLHLPVPTDCETETKATQWIESQATEVQQSLDISKGQLIKVAFFDASQLPVADTASHLLIAVHHLAIDGVSWRILLNDLQSAYHSTVSGALTDGFNPDEHNIMQAWANKLADYAQSEELKSQLDYWCQTQQVSDFPQQNSHGRNDLASVQRIKRSLSTQKTDKLLKQVPIAYRSQIQHILLAALSEAVALATETDCLHVELEGHGREDIDGETDLSQTFGWFTSRYPVYLSAPKSASEKLSDGKRANSKQASAERVAILIKSVKEQLQQIPQNGLGYGLLRYLTHNLSESQQQDLKQRQQAPLSFNYLGQFDLERQEQSLLSETTVGTGQERDLNSARRHLIDINAMVKNGQLHLEWHFSENRHTEQWISALADTYMTCLSQLIEHCLLPDTSGATPSDFPLARLQQSQLDSMDLNWRNVESLYPLSPMQEGLLFHTLMNPGSGIYFMQYCYELQGVIDHDAFVQAWQQVVQRHQVLRTAFIRQEEQALQVVHRSVPTPVTILDWRHLTATEQQSKLKDQMSQQVERGFDLSKPTQMAITLIQVADDKYQMVRSFHHILTDAWCFSLLMMDFLSYYRGIIEGQHVHLGSPRPFEDYIAWLQKQDMQNAEHFWRDSLTGFEAPNSLAVDKPQGKTGVQDKILYLSHTEIDSLQTQANSLQVTVNTLVQGAWGLLLSRYSGDSDVVFGVTVAGRPTDLEGAENTVGLFINTLPLRVNASAAQSVADYLKGIFEQNLKMREYEFAPLVEIQRWSDVPAGETLFNSLFVFENAPIDPEMYDKLSILEVGNMTNRTHTNYPITVVVMPEEQRLGLQITYDKGLFADSVIDGMLAHFKRILLNMAGMDHADNSHTFASIRDIELLSVSEQKQLLTGWNQTRTDYPREQCWPELFAEQVQRTPDSIAVACDKQTLTYQQLFDRSARIARGLRASGVKANDVVAILDDRGIDLLCMIVGVLQSGAAYLPLDPNHPQKRWANVIELSAPNVVLTQTDGASNREEVLSDAMQSLTQCTASVLIMDRLLQQFKAPVDGIVEPELRYNPQDLAYVIYTSGSTGTPKGAMVEHLGMLNNQYSKIPTLGLTERDVVAQTASQCFDISVWQFLTALLCGAKVQIYPDDIARHPQELLKQVEQDNVTILESVPSLIQGFLEYSAELTHLRWLMPTGEALTSELAKNWLQQYPHIPLLNAYGPAECADDVALWPIKTAAEAAVDPMPVGRPTDNNRLYVLDDLQRLQPVGVPGELYVAGAGVGRGYLNDVARTSAAFLDNPLLSHSAHTSDDLATLDNPNRLYRTGDLASWREDGVLEYLGRTDHQVKIRGFRIELGEIEACLEAMPQVRFAAVVVKADQRGDDALVAYCELQTDAKQNPSENPSETSFIQTLKQQIRQELPVYMMPSLFVMLEAMPLNNNGKIDRRSLPEPDYSANGNIKSGSLGPSLNLPRNETEKALVSLWQRILKIEQVDIHASFFELGGHSLIAAQLHARVCQQFAIDLPLRTLFEQNSVAEVALQVDKLLAAKLLLTDSDEADEAMEEFEL